MRTVTAAERGYISGLRPWSYAKLEITNESGTYVDYSTGLLGPDFFNSVTLDENIDSDCVTLSGSLLRCAGTLSLSPFMASSALNLTSGSYATKLDLWRKWRVSAAVTREGYPPTGTDWKEIVQGRVDRINIVGDEIQIAGRSEEAILLQRWIATERQYGSVGGIAIETVMQSMLDDNLGSGTVTLYCPVSPGFNMNVWVQPKGNLMAALTAVAEKAGMVLRYRYDASDVYRLTLLKPNRTATVEDWAIGPSEYTSVPLNQIDLRNVRNFIKVRFADATLGTQTVIYPHMAGTGTVACTAGAATFSSSQAGVLQNGAEIIVAGIAYTVSAFDGTTGCTLLAQLQTGGVPTFTAAAFTAHGTLSGTGLTTSITRFGRVDMEIDLSFTSQVNNATNAQGFADAVGSDMEFPNLEQQFEGIGLWFVQLYDYGRFYANNVHYDTDQLAGVTSIHHDLSKGSFKTTLGVRGKPAGRYTTWKLLGVSGGTVAVATIPLLLRLKVQSTTATQTVVRVAVADANPLGDIAIAYASTGVTSVSPASPQTVLRANVTSDLDTTGTVDFTITRGTGGGTGRVTFTASSPARLSSTDSADVSPSRLTGGGSTPTLSNVHAFWNGTNTVTGTDTAGVVSLNKTATSATESNATQFKLTFAAAYAATPYVLITSDVSFGSGSAGDMVISAVTTTDFTVSMVRATLLATGTSLQTAVFRYAVIG